MSEAPKHIHFCGICGTAMASLAGLLQLQGHRITGSDKAAYPPMSELLHGLGIPVMEPYSEENLSPAPDLVVIGNALSRGNPEVERILDERIPFTSMAALLHEEFLEGRESLVVAGHRCAVDAHRMGPEHLQPRLRRDAKLFSAGHRRGPGRGTCDLRYPRQL